MYCNKCGETLDSTAKVCPKCGTAVGVSTEVSQGGPQSTAPVTKPAKSPKIPAEKNKMMGLVVIASFAVVVAVISGLAFWNHFRVKEKKALEAELQAERAAAGLAEPDKEDSFLSRLFSPKKQEEVSDPMQEPGGSTSIEPGDTAEQNGEAQQEEQIPYIDSLEVQPSYVVPENERKHCRIATDSDELRMRRGPGTDYEVITGIPKGETVTQIGNVSGVSNWIIVYYNGEFGWVCTDYLEFLDW